MSSRSMCTTPVAIRRYPPPTCTTAAAPRRYTLVHVDRAQGLTAPRLLMSATHRRMRLLPYYRWTHFSAPSSGLPPASPPPRTRWRTTRRLCMDSLAADVGADSARGVGQTDALPVHRAPDDSQNERGVNRPRCAGGPSLRTGSTSGMDLSVQCRARCARRPSPGGGSSRATPTLCSLMQIARSGGAISARGRTSGARPGVSLASGGSAGATRRSTRMDVHIGTCTAAARSPRRRHGDPRRQLPRWRQEVLRDLWV
ncbi:hypothetical protein B0H10DRAFT_213475 [Mycena sp. CBHHK59/15]|nr:hypothetical protein B0H10DRAFT_213475 [Mycena sp. CBHHK59/15]